MDNTTLTGAILCIFLSNRFTVDHSRYLATIEISWGDLQQITLDSLMFKSSTLSSASARFSRQIRACLNYKDQIIGEILAQYLGLQHRCFSFGLPYMATVSAKIRYISRKSHRCESLCSALTHERTIKGFSQLSSCIWSLRIGCFEGCNRISTSCSLSCSQMMLTGGGYILPGSNRKGARDPDYVAYISIQ